VPGIVDEDHDAARERLAGDAEHRAESIDDLRGPGVVQPEQNDPGGRAAREGCELTEVEVEGQEGVGYGTRTSSRVSQAAYSMACWMSSRSRPG